jgi:hypothetical protein
MVNQILGWMSQPWQVVMAASGSSNQGLVAPDSLIFTPGTTTGNTTTPNTISFQPATGSNPVPWGTWWTTTSSTDTVAGVTTSGQPFHIFYDSSNSNPSPSLTCTLDPPSSLVRRRLGAAAFGALAGALAGGVAGALAGLPFMGSLVVSAVAAVTGSVVTTGAEPDFVNGPMPTWVANDGGAGGRIGNPGTGQGGNPVTGQGGSPLTGLPNRQAKIA